jgi:hypothetical protein
MEFHNHQEMLPFYWQLLIFTMRKKSKAKNSLNNQRLKYVLHGIAMEVTIQKLVN